MIEERDLNESSEIIEQLEIVQNTLKELYNLSCLAEDGEKILLDSILSPDITDFEKDVIGYIEDIEEEDGEDVKEPVLVTSDSAEIENDENE